VAATDGSFVGRWLLDRREGEAAVYLPYASFAGRPSRAPRPGLLIGADGAYSWLAAGEADGHVRGASGRWLRSGPDAIELQPEDGSSAMRVHFVAGQPPSLVTEA
jgi:hypothetical protein